MACALAMTALHAVLLLGAPALSGSGALGYSLSGHAHAAAPAHGAGAAAGAEGLLAVVVLEITTAFLAATLLARLRSVHAEMKH
jgi:hypothetical protein